MFGECHAHIIMDGVNYRHAIDMHKNGLDDKIIREHLKAYQERGIAFVRDGGDALGVSARAKELAPEFTHPKHYRKPSRKLWNALTQTLPLKCSLTMCGFAFPLQM